MKFLHANVLDIRMIYSLLEYKICRLKSYFLLSSTLINTSRFLPPTQFGYTKHFSISSRSMDILLKTSLCVKYSAPLTAWNSLAFPVIDGLIQISAICSLQSHKTIPRL
ncbi:UNVERIFIED_CONTAM: hypothetical protein K2H54_062300 [Gekko kuhli]